MGKINDTISLFVPGRLCLFGEHSDWAGVNRTMNPDIVPGCAIVTGVEQGIYGIAYKSEKFCVKSFNSDGENISFECAMNMEELRIVAREGGFFSYMAGVASYMCEWYHVGGITVEITDMSLPMKAGLSSSAAICVLVARAFNIIYDLRLNTLGIMNIAYWGELRTPSRCGRLDQACAFGVNPVSMVFDGNELDVDKICIKEPLYYVFADLMAGKDTVKILRDLSEAYPFASDDVDRNVQEALGPDNKIITDRAKLYMTQGRTKELGQLMIEAQRLFDAKIAPKCPDELKAPVLHSVLNDERVKELTFGAKGVGSQGDGTVQFLAKDEETQKELIEYLESVRGMKAYKLTLKPNVEVNEDSMPDSGVSVSNIGIDKVSDEEVYEYGIVKKAIIPVAGFGTRMYPLTRGVKKEFCPVVDKDGLTKPGILILLEELDRIGIEQICLILNRDEKVYYEDFFFKPLSEKHLDKLSPKLLEYEDTIKRIASKLTFAFQEEQRGFGHAVYEAASFAGTDPVLLLLGDTIYSSNSDIDCTKQLIDAYNQVKRPVIGVQSVPVDTVANFGLFAGEWTNDLQTLMKLDRIKEKPTPEYARANLNVKTNLSDENYYAAFGTYIITKEIFDRLEEAIANNIVNAKNEIELTDALAYVSENYGMYACVIDGKSYDLGNPVSYRNAVSEFGR